MDQRLSLITLGVADVDRARSFYEGLGWTTGADAGDDVVFFQAGGIIVALWDRASLAEDSRVEDTGGWGGVTLAYNVNSPAEVDAALAEAEAAGAEIPRAGAETFWGGYSGALHRPRRAPVGGRPQPPLDRPPGRADHPQLKNSASSSPTSPGASSWRKWPQPGRPVISAPPGTSSSTRDIVSATSGRIRSSSP